MLEVIQRRQAYSVFIMFQALLCDQIYCIPVTYERAGVLSVPMKATAAKLSK
jgi:hypothetical protein